MSTIEIEDRRRLELHLHDGAQERFVLAALALRRAASEVRGLAAEPRVAEAFDQLQRGLAELRDLGRGIHPNALRYGLATALEGVAARADVPVELRVATGRLDAAVEAALYFAVSEALANVDRHARATRATVTVARAGDAVVAEIADDGVGGASLADGLGLRGLAERLQALSGRLELESPSGSGTTVRAVVPL